MNRLLAGLLFIVVEAHDASAQAGASLESLLKESRAGFQLEEIGNYKQSFPEWTSLLYELGRKYKIGQADIRLLGQFIARSDLYDSKFYGYDRLLYESLSFLFFDRPEKALELVRSIDSAGLDDVQNRMLTLLHLSALIEVKDRDAIKVYLSKIIANDSYLSDDRILTTCIRASELLSPGYQLDTLLKLRNAKISKSGLSAVYKKLVAIDAKQIAIPYSTLRLLSLASDLTEGLHGWLVSRAVNGAISQTGSDSEEVARLKLLLRLGEHKHLLKLASRFLSQTAERSDERVSYLSLITDSFLSQDRFEEAKEFSFLALSELGFSKSTVSLWERYAISLSELQEYRSAAVEYRKIMKFENQRHIRWYYFWSLYRAGDYKVALELIQSLRRPELFSRDYREPEGIYYWQAKLLLKLGKTRQANQLFSRLLEHHGDGFYANLISESYPELVTTRGFSTAISTSNVKVIQLDDYDLWRENRNFYLDEIKSYSSFSDLISSQAKDLDDWQRAYPLINNAWLERVGNFFGVDSLLLASIMRAESFYNPSARSPVGAQGLMQIMPYTGIKISREMGDLEFRIDELYNPKVSLVYSGHYLSRLMDYFSGHPVLVLAAYNAGPSRAKQWLERCAGCSLDEFIETISFKETRNYVKKILRYYTNYKRIYRNQMRLNLANSLPTRLEQDASIY